MTSISTIRLLNQQLAAPQFNDPASVVSHMGAMQAQEYRMMRWAVGMRTRKPSAKAFKKAFDNGQILRLHLMRGTWQLVSADDFWPLVELCAPKALAVIKGWMHSNNIYIPDEEVHDCKPWPKMTSLWTTIGCHIIFVWPKSREPCAAVTFCP